MPGPLEGLRVIEVSAFVAAPLAGLTLAQLGAEVIRIDPIGGNIDTTRWPITSDGASLSWSGLNKGKRTVTIDVRSPEGQELATRLICAPGADAGILLTNLPDGGWMSYERLRERREDLIMMRLTGNFDGTTAVDYTVNSASGFPHATGPNDDPVNHVLPAWDISSGLYLALGILAAERVRRETGRGQLVNLALSDVMLATVANLGYVGDVQINGVSREPQGNYLYGAFGRDFETRDGRRLMIAAISHRQWRAIGEATGLTERLALIGPLMDVDLDDEGGRYLARHAIAALLESWVAGLDYAEVEACFSGTRVLWGPYQTFGELVQNDPRCSTRNPLFESVEHEGIGSILTPRVPLTFSDSATPHAMASHEVGADTEVVVSWLNSLDNGGSTGSG